MRKADANPSNIPRSLPSCGSSSRRQLCQVRVKPGPCLQAKGGWGKVEGDVVLLSAGMAIANVSPSTASICSARQVAVKQLAQAGSGAVPHMQSRDATGPMLAPSSTSIPHPCSQRKDHGTRKADSSGEG